MMLINRQKSVAILLILLLSHAALTLHVSTHIPVDQNSCEYCAGHADPSHAMSPAIAQIPQVAGPALFTDIAAVPPQTASIVSYRQRAPPSLI